MKAVNDPYTGSVRSKRGEKGRGASVMWQHRPEQGSKKQPFLLTSLGAGSEPPSRSDPPSRKLTFIFKYFVFLLCLLYFGFVHVDRIIHLEPDSLPKEVKGSLHVNFSGHLNGTFGCGKHSSQE